MKKKLGLIFVVGMVLGVLGCGTAGEENGSGALGTADSGFDLISSDAKALNTTIKSYPISDSVRTAKFTFICNQKPCTFKCSLDSGAYKTCITQDLQKPDGWRP